jgi:hypothetical protein
MSCVSLAGPLAVVLSLTSAVSADAQDSTAPENPTPTVEIGIGASGLPAVGIYGPGVRVSIARKQPFAFELGMDWTDLGRKERYVDQIIGFYFWQVKHVLNTRDKAGPRLFATYGTAGWFERVPPLFPVIGFGGQQVIAKHAAVRVEAQLIVLWGEVPVTGRLSGGVSIPIGGYR